VTPRGGDEQGGGQPPNAGEWADDDDRASLGTGTSLGSFVDDDGDDVAEVEPPKPDAVTRGAAAVGRRLSSQADLSRQRGAYNGALEAIFSILIATGAGYWADQSYGTSPRWLVVGAVIGFAAFVLRIMRMRELLEEPEEPVSDDRPDAGSR